MSDKFAVAFNNSKSKISGNSVTIHKPNQNNTTKTSGAAPGQSIPNKGESSNYTNVSSEQFTKPLVPVFNEDQPVNFGSADDVISAVRQKPLLLWGALALAVGWIYIRAKNN